MSVDYKCRDWYHCEDERNMIKALSGGTCEMRLAGEALLPREPVEEVADYDNRLKRSFLFNAYSNAKESFVGKIYANPVQIDGEHPLLEQITEDADLMGRDITSFMRAVQDDAFDNGVSYILVDMPQAPPEYTKAEENELNLRPYLTHIKRENLIGWDFERIGGIDVLREVRIEERFYERKYPDGVDEKGLYNWEETEIRQVRVISESEGVFTYQIWREDDNKASWGIIEEGPWTVDHITLVPVATKMISRMVGEPPLRDMAFLNVQHWQSASDQKQILHTARVPILFGKALGEDNKLTSVGQGAAVWASDPESDLKYVELQGNSIEAGREDIKDIEDRMAILALEPQVSRTGNVTATSKAIDQAKANTQVEAWSLAAEDAINTALNYCFMWLNTDVEFEVSLDRDFGIGAETSEDAKILIEMWKNGGLTLEDLMKELKRRNILNPDFDVEVGAAQVDETLEGDLLTQVTN